MGIDKLEKQEAQLIEDVIKFEQSYEHQKPCKRYDAVGYCSHVQIAERKRFSEKNRQLIAARLTLREL